MAQQIRDNERPLTRQEALALKNRRTLVTVFQMSWILVFVSLVIVNLQIRSTIQDLPALTPIQFIPPLLATAAILISGWTAHQGVKAIRANQRDTFLIQWRYTLVLGGAFLAVMIAIFIFNPYVGIPQYGAIFRVMIGYHAVHALVIGGWMIQVFRNAQAGAYSPRDYWGVEAAAKLWYFVIIAWILFYVVLFLI
jgi:cytochrome c oxidase subunit 3